MTQMSSIDNLDQLKDIESVVYLRLRDSRGYFMVSNVASDEDISPSGKEMVISMIRSRRDIICVSGFLKYIDINMKMMDSIASMISDLLEYDRIDLKAEYTRHSDRYKAMGIASHQELIAILFKFMRQPPSLTTIEIDSKSVRESLDSYKSILESDKSDEDEQPDTQSEFDVSEFVPTSYQKLEDIKNRYFMVTGKRINQSKIVAELERDTSIVSKHPSLYRRINITTEDLDELLLKASSILKLTNVKYGVVFNAIRQDLMPKDVITELEFRQLVNKRLPHLISPVSNELNLSSYLEKQTPSNDSVPCASSGFEIIPIPDGYNEDWDPIFDDRYGEMEGCSEIEGAILDVLQDGSVTPFSKIRKILITDYDADEVHEALDKLVDCGVLFFSGAGYRYHTKIKLVDVWTIVSGSRGQIISLDKLFQRYRKEFNDIDIRAQYELKTYIELLPNTFIVEKNNNLISIGGVDFEQFIRDKSNLSVDDNSLPYILLENYGIPREITNQVLDDKDIKMVRKERVDPYDNKGLIPFISLFTEEFYLERDFYDLIKKSRPDLKTENLSAKDLAILGFKKRDGLIYSSDYDSPYGAVVGYLNRRDNVQFSEGQLANPLIKYVLDNKQKEMEWFQYSCDRYIRITKFKKAGIDKGSINDYLNKLSSFYLRRTFTLKRMKLDGFNDLDILGFNDPIFYERILAIRFRVGYSEGVTMFRYDLTPALNSIITQIVDESDHIFIDDIPSKLEDDYGLVKNSRAIAKSIKSTSLYLPEGSEIVYKDIDAAVRCANGSNEE